MKESPSQRRLAENEVVFRQLNESLQKGIEETNRLAEEDGQPEYLIIPKANDEPLHFFCECSDETCAKRVKINLQKYIELHKPRNHFVLVPGHEVLAIEKIIARHEPKYIVVEKLVKLPDTPDKLNPTAIDNK